MGCGRWREGEEKDQYWKTVMKKNRILPVESISVKIVLPLLIFKIIMNCRIVSFKNLLVAHWEYLKLVCF